MKKAVQTMAALLLAGCCVLGLGCGGEKQAGAPSQGAQLLEKVSKAEVRADFAPLTEIKAGRKNVYAVLKVIKGAYWQEVVRGLKEGGEKAGCNVYLGGALREVDWQSQQELLQELAAKQCDGVILAPADSSKLIPAATALYQKKIPVVLVDSVLNSKDYSACYETDNFAAGGRAAAEMLKQLQEGGNKAEEPLTVAIKVSNLAGSAMVERLEGANAYWVDHAPASWKLDTAALVDHGDSSLGEKLAAAALEKVKNLKGFIGCNNRATDTAAAAIKAAGRKDVVLVGFDYGRETAALLKEPGYRGVTLVQNQYQMAFEAVQTVAGLLQGGKVAEQLVYKDVTVVTKDNCQAYEEGLKGRKP